MTCYTMIGGLRTCRRSGACTQLPANRLMSCITALPAGCKAGHARLQEGQVRCMQLMDGQQVDVERSSRPSVYIDQLFQPHNIHG